MAKILFNPTNEEFRQFHGGIEVIIKPFPEDGHKLRIDSDSKANHILNALGPRGLCVLEYGDESKDKEDAIAEAGLKRSKEFKIRQIVRYNQDNEKRKQTNLAYVDPPQAIKDYSVELGMELITPYETSDAKNTQIMDLTQSNEEMRKTLQDMQRQMAIMVMEKTGVKPETDEELNIRNIRQEYIMLQKSDFKQYVSKNKDRFAEFPISVQEDIDAKWSKMFGDEERPK